MNESNDIRPDNSSSSASENAAKPGEQASLSRMHFVSGCIFGLLLINLCKELPYIGNQEIGLLQGGEVSALRHASSLNYVICLSNPAKRRDSHLLRKIGIAHRSLQVWRRHRFLYVECP